MLLNNDECYKDGQTGWCEGEVLRASGKPSQMRWLLLQDMNGDKELHRHERREARETRKAKPLRYVWGQGMCLSHSGCCNKNTTNI